MSGIRVESNSHNGTHAPSIDSDEHDSVKVLHRSSSSSMAETAKWLSGTALVVSVGVAAIGLCVAAVVDAWDGHTVKKEPVDIFARGSANIHWCEDHLAKQHNITSISVEAPLTEFWNTWTNLAYILAGLYGLRQCHLQQLPWANVLTECQIIVVGLGSLFFHATQTRIAEYWDELPMSVLAALYHETGRGLHPCSRPPYSKYLYGFSQTTMVVLLTIYLYTHIHEFFLLCFTFQLVILLVFCVDAAARLNVPYTNFVVGVVFLATSKLCWEVEQWRYNAGLCELPGTLWLHPIWHVGGATAHVFFMKFGSQVYNAHRESLLPLEKKQN